MATTPINRFWNLLKQYNPILRLIYIYALFIGIVNLTLPVGIQAIINYLQPGEFSSTWLLLVGFVLFGMALTGILQVLQLRLVENIQQDLFARSAFEIAFRIPRITFLQLDKVHAPELVNRFFDTVTLQKGLPKILIDFSLAIFQIFFGLILLTVYSPYFIILGFILGIIIWVIFKVTGPKGLTTSLKESKYKYQMAHWLEEVARVNLSFKLFNKEKLHLDKTDTNVGNYLESRENHFKILMQQFWLFIGFKVILAAGLLVLGGILVFQEKINLGQFVAAEIVIILIINSVEKVLRLVETIYDVLTGLEKIGYITDLELEENNGTAKVQTPNGLSLRAENVFAGFADMSKSTIQNLSFRIEPNEKVFLTGSSGSGKALLIRTLAGIHPLTSGEIFVDDIPFLNYNRADFSDTVGVAFPANHIFEGSIMENISMGRKLPEKDLAEILHVLQLESFINAQQLGINAMLDSGGRRISKSIAQKLLLARILVHRPKLLLLEDPLQYINNDEKVRIIDYLMDTSYKATIIVDSDYPYWKQKCDRIIDLNS